DAVIIATSGTSGLPKAVIHTHASVEASAVATSKALDVDPSTDRWLACLPLAHIGGLAVVMRSMVTETPVEVHDRFDPRAVISAAGAGATLVSLVTRALNQVRPELFRTVLIGGGVPPPNRPANVIATYGMTETGSGIVYETSLLDGAEISIGPPGPATGRSASRGNRDETLGRPDGTAEIHLRGPMLFRGYRSRPDPFDRNGWFPTGDLGSWGPDGELVVIGRRGDLIVTGGEKVWPEPVERLLLNRPDIAQVALIGRPDPEWGRKVVAVIVPAAGHVRPALGDVREAVRAELPIWAAPKEIEFAEDLPRTALGKVRRNLL
ncbi:MAG: class I adenylate-forming enzyme family protein, partial [Acidimicrobiales bacterium]